MTTTSARGAAEARYVATGACAGCPYQVHCHEARQYAMDRAGIGRHTTCTYYHEFVRRALSRVRIRRTLGDRILDAVARSLSRAADRIRERAR